MNKIYTNKGFWKRVLFAAAATIVGLSLWYSQLLVDKIGKEERKKVKLWAEAIQKKAKLVNYTDKLFDELRLEERKKVEQYTEAIKRLTNAGENTDFTFLTRILTDNTTVPVILTDADGRIKTTRNLDSTVTADAQKMQVVLKEMKQTYPPIEVRVYGDQVDYVYYKDSRLFEDLQRVFDDLEKSFISEIVTNSASVPVIYTDSSAQEILAFGNVDSSVFNSPERLQKTIASMKAENDPIEVHLQDDQTNYIYYQDSALLIQLRYYPFIQVGVIGLFALIAYFLFSTSRKEEQNRVWVGLAKETAHQLGTPLSSLMAWLEMLKEKAVEPELIKELEKDIKRLETITDRFSKIGSKPKLEAVNLKSAIEKALGYMQSRSSKKIQFSVQQADANLTTQLNIPLFEWVVENLTKNAIDAMNGNGSLSYQITSTGNQVFIDVTDTGKGIPAAKKQAVFQPGYTTKKRGWGLGLSLVKRIIENYHNGKIFVKWSEVGKGTTFRIVLNKA